MQFQVKHEPPMTRGLMEHISPISLLQHKGGNCLDIGLSLATDCEKEERYTIASSRILPTRYDRGDNDRVGVENVIKQEDGVSRAMKRQTAVSFLDWVNKDEYRMLELKNGDKARDLERMGSGMSTLSGCGGDSDGSGDEPRKAYKNCPPWGLHRIWAGADAAKPSMLRSRNTIINDFKPEEQQDHKAATEEEKLSQGVEQTSGEEDDEKKPPLPLREHMFDKAVTPSDVGKLNRLVIPKQHAEKFFPLDTNANEKGLLLNFEDSIGKAWRFRYSYWNSSQSYVLTKGWSRFVKEKKLYAGDIVSFERGTDQNVHRLFISWRRRPVQHHPSFTDPPPHPSKAALLPSHIQYRPFQSHALNIIGRQAQLQGTVIPACSKVFPQWMSLVWPANGGGASSRAAEMWAQPLPQPMEASFFHSSAKAADLRDTSRVPLDFMQLSPPMEAKAGTGFDPSTSRKRVRLFGVNL